MSHTWKCGHTSFIGNGDLSGDIEIVEDNGHQTFINGDDLKEFIAEYVRQKRLERIESLSSEEILSL